MGNGTINSKVSTQLRETRGKPNTEVKKENTRPQAVSTEGSKNPVDRATLSNEAKSEAKSEKPGSLPNLAAAFGNFDDESKPESKTDQGAVQKQSGAVTSVADLKRQDESNIQDVQRQQEDAKRQQEADQAAKSSAKTLVEKNTNWGGLNLDEENLGKDLAASKDPKLMRETLRQVGQNKGEVSYETLKSMSDEDMTAMSKTPEGRAMLERMGTNVAKPETEHGKNSPEEKAQLERIEKLTGKRPEPFDPMKSVDFKGEVPKSLEAAGDDQGRVDLSKVTPEMISGMSGPERKAFMEQVKGQNINLGKITDRDPSAKGLGKAEEYLLDNLASQENSSKAVTEAFSSLPADVQTSMKIGPEASREVVDQMPLLVKSIHERAEAEKGDRKGILDPDAGDVIANVVKNYPVENGQDMRVLAERIGQSKDAVPGGKPMYNEGFLTGAALRGFEAKGDEFKAKARELDAASELVDLAALGTPASVALKVAMKAGQFHLDDKGESYGKTGGRIASEISTEWQRNDSLTPDDRSTLREAMENGSDQKY